MNLSNSYKKNSFSICFLLLIVTIGFAQENDDPAVESFESASVLSKYDQSNGKLSLSRDHHRYGKTSLQWEWTSESTIGTSNFKILSLDESPLDYGDYFPASPTLQMSIYNETPQKGNITIAFEKNGAAQVHFEVNTDFKGWRRIWVPFYEMQGNPPKKGAQIDYDYFKISTSLPSGKLFFDDIVFSQFQDDRHQYPDEIVPFIKAGQNLAADHWMPLIENYNRIKKLVPEPISKAMQMDLKKLEELIDQEMVISKSEQVPINSLQEDFEKLNIKDNGQTALGPPLTFKEYQNYHDKKLQGARNDNDIKALGKVLKKLADYYGRANLSEKEAIKTMFLTGTKYFLDQGWQAGSNGGTRHHIGYNVREIAEAFFIMRQLLNDNGLLNEIGASLHWLYNIGMLLGNPENFHVNIDYLNTQSYYHLMLVFLFEKQEMQAAMLQAYSNYISIILAQQNEEWGFKVDGTSWHHNGHYPAYGIGAFSSVPRIIKMLSGTRFRISTEGHKNFKKSFLTTRIYSQLYDWGFGNAGRHPLEGNSIEDLQKQYLQMAFAGNSEGTSEIDKDVAAAYLRLWGAEDEVNSSLFTNLHGIQKEHLSGYYTLPYAASAIQRQDNWAAIIKGYSKYVWASEIYVTANRYGRYPANGTIQLLHKKGEKGSGFQQEGWDWNRYPGATIINLPLTELEPKMPLIMFRSNETFAGTAKLGNDGIFGMILNEGKGSNADGPEMKLDFPGKLKAKKSVFSFGDKLICVGTDISSIDNTNPTQTNLFQTYLQDDKDPIYTSTEKIIKFPFVGKLPKNKKAKNWIIDPYGNGYHILSNNAVHFKKEKQNSYHNKYSANTGQIDKAAKGVKETEGDYATAWINHGLAPKDACYQYVIYPFLREDEVKNFGKIALKDDSYKVLRADNIAHIVKDEKTNTIGYVVFESDTDLKNGILKSVSKPALVMARKEDANKMTLSVVQPDLNFPEIRLGKFKNYSRPVQFTISLAGKWDVAISGAVKSVDNSTAITTITLECIDGLSNEFSIQKVSHRN